MTEATVEQLAAVEAVRIASWQAGYRGLVPDAYLDAMTVTAEKVALMTQRFSDGIVPLVAVDGDDVVGMAAHGPCRDDDRANGHELYALYVLPSHWGGGAGGALLAAAGDVTSLWALDGNARAHAFYLKHGFAPDGRVEPFGDTGVPLQKARYVLR